MSAWVIRRALYMLVSMLMITIVSFVIIQLPPGDYLTSYISSLEETGQRVDAATVEALTKQYGLDLPIYQQYFFWMWKVVRGNFGKSFQWNLPVDRLLAERFPLTMAIALLALVFIYVVSIPIGIYSATHQYSIGDYVVCVAGFTGLAIPSFLLALILVFVFYKYFGLNLSGLFSQKYIGQPWNAAKFFNMLMHLPLPILVVGAPGTAALIRVMRGCLLDELQKQYVITARAKGVDETALLFKYPVRVAVNPIISTIGWTLPQIISGATIAAIVLGLPDVGSLLFTALMSQDMYLAATIVLFLTSMTIVGTFISDILLAWIDPRIHYERAG